MHSKYEKTVALNDAIIAQRWDPTQLAGTSEESLAEACFEAGYELGYHTLPLSAAPAPAAVSLTEREAGEENASKQWVIVSMVEGRGKPYWRPNSAGYTDSFTDAGRYSYSEARQITSGCHGDAVKYCVDDPALYDLIAYENLARGKEIKLWLQNASLLAQLAKAEAGAASPTRKGSSEMTAEECLHEVRERLLNHSAAEEAHLIAVDLPELISLVIGPLPQPPSGPAVMHTGGPDLTDLPF